MQRSEWSDTEIYLAVFNASRGMESAEIAALLQNYGFQRSEGAITAKLFRLKGDNPILVKGGGWDEQGTETWLKQLSQ